MPTQDITESGYIIADTVFFNPADATITNLITGDTIALGITAGRLLLLILDSGHQVLAREYLLEKVWDDNGLTGSGSNLYQYLSILRRSLKTMELDEVIITVPRTGIYLSEGIKVIPPQANHGDKDVLINGNHPAPKKTTLYKHLVYLFCICGSLIFLFVFIGIFYFKIPFVQKDTYFLVNVSSCSIYYLKPANKYESHKIINLVNNFMKNKKLTCNEKKDIYFDYYPSFSAQGYDRMLFSYCDLSAKGTTTTCSNFYEYSWVVE